MKIQKLHIMLFIAIIVCISACKSKQLGESKEELGLPKGFTPNIEIDGMEEIVDVPDHIKMQFDSISKSLKREKLGDTTNNLGEGSFVEVCAYKKGWHLLTEFSNQKALFMDASRGGYWTSNGEKFDITGRKHYDRRHPFPKMNAMALIIAVQDTGKDEVRYYAFKKDPFGEVKDIWKSVTPYYHRIYGMINDWQCCGLRDNSGCLTIYAGSHQ